MMNYYDLAKDIADQILAETDNEVQALIVAEYVRVRLGEKAIA